eukprot:UN00915
MYDMLRSKYNTMSCTDWLPPLLAFLSSIILILLFHEEILIHFGIYPYRYPLYLLRIILPLTIVLPSYTWFAISYACCAYPLAVLPCRLCCQISTKHHLVDRSFDQALLSLPYHTAIFRSKECVHLHNPLTKVTDLKALDNYYKNVNIIKENILQCSSDIPTLQFEIICSHSKSSLAGLASGGPLGNTPTITYHKNQYIPILHYRHIGLSPDDFITQLDHHNKQHPGFAVSDRPYHPTLIFS